METKHFTDVAAEDVGGEAMGVQVRWLIDKKMGAPHFAMRHFTIAPGGNTPFHTHDWEHEVYGLSGSGVAVGEAGEKPFGPGVWVYMPPGEKHQFRNTGSEPMTMICMVPHPE